MEIIGIGLIVSLGVWIYWNRPKRYNDEWHRVPPPNWRSKRGGEYW